MEGRAVWRDVVHRRDPWRFWNGRLGEYGSKEGTGFVVAAVERFEKRGNMLTADRLCRYVGPLLRRDQGPVLRCPGSRV